MNIVSKNKFRLKQFLKFLLVYQIMFLCLDMMELFNMEFFQSALKSVAESRKITVDQLRTNMTALAEVFGIAVADVSSWLNCNYIRFKFS